MKRIIVLEKIQNVQNKKLKATQNRTFFKMIENLPSTNLEHIILEYKKHQSSHYKNVGIVFFPQKNPRY
jgi:hypothetical protein